MTNVITSVSDYLEKLKKITVGEDSQLFYRGVSNEEYATPDKNIPSIYRKSGWIQNEDKMFYELVSRVPEEFKDCQNTFEYLVKMQHYGYPTRLLDITSNPLVALYFACSGDEDNEKDGVVILFNIKKNDIRNYESDRVLLLANLALSKRCITLTDFIINEVNEVLDKYFLYKKYDFDLPYLVDINEINELVDLLLVLEDHFNILINLEEIKSFSIKLILAHLFIILKNALEYEDIYSNVGIYDDIDLAVHDYIDLTVFDKLRLLHDNIRHCLINQNFPIDEFASLRLKQGLQDVIREHVRLIHDYSKKYLNIRKSFDEYGYSLKSKKFHFNTGIIKLNDIYTVQCVIPKQTNPRIISQQGAFLLFGLSNNHKDSILDSPIQENTELANGMKKLNIDKSSKDQILKDLSRLGVSESIIFPEIDNITKEIKKNYIAVDK